MMRKGCLLALAILFSTSAVGGSQRVGQAAETYPYYGVGALPADYIYRTAQVYSPAKENKTIWDYLSFFALSEKKKVQHEVAAEEAIELKMRVRELGRQLMVNSVESVADEYVVTVSSFVNLNNLYQISSLGRYVGEQLIGELQLAGVEVIDIRKTPSLMIHERQGEYGLSRKMEELSYIHTAHATVVGTYTFFDDQILINARLLRNPDGMVISQANIVFELDPMTKGLLADESMPPRSGSKVSVQAFQE